MESSFIIRYIGFSTHREATSTPVFLHVLYINMLRSLGSNFKWYVPQISYPEIPRVKVLNKIVREFSSEFDNFLK